MPPPQLVPIGQIPHYVLVLCDPLPVGGIVAPPVAERVHVEVLPLQVDALAYEQVVDMVNEPVPSILVAEVQQAATGATEDSLRMVVGEPRAGGHALQFEPDSGFDP